MPSREVTVYAFRTEQNLWLDRVETDLDKAREFARKRGLAVVPTKATVDSKDDGLPVFDCRTPRMGLPPLWWALLVRARLEEPLGGAGRGGFSFRERDRVEELFRRAGLDAQVIWGEQQPIHPLVFTDGAWCCGACGASEYLRVIEVTERPFRISDKRSSDVEVAVVAADDEDEPVLETFAHCGQCDARLSLPGLVDVEVVGDEDGEGG